MDVKKKKKRIVFLLPSMRGGGSEKVISLILNYIDKNQFEPILLLLQKEGTYLYDLPEDLKIVDLNVTKARYAVFKIFKVLKCLRPDIIMSTLGHINILLALMKPFLANKMRFIARESSIVSVNNQNSKYPRIFDFLYKKVFNRFETIIAQSYYMRNDLIDNYDVNPSKIKVIYNPLDILKIQKLAEENCEYVNNTKFNLLIVGRLSVEKNHREILKIMKILPKEYYLTIVGDGSLKKELINQVDFLEIKDKVTFVNFDKNPYKYMKKADTVVSMSFYEGFPNVLIEALACGTPVVAYNGKGGTAEIVQDGVNGYLIEFGNINQFVESIIKIKQNPFDNQTIQKTAEQYDVSKIIQKYEVVFNEEK